MATVDELVGMWPQLDGLLEAGDNAEAADCDMVVIATPWDSAASTAHHAAASRFSASRSSASDGSSSNAISK